ncbi:MAG: ROK family protein [Pseudomonadota bacterium]
MAYDPDTMTLVADVGGTNTRVALADGPKVLKETIRKYRNAEYPGLESVLKDYIAKEDDVDTKACCVCIAGPVRDGVGSLTNLNWTIDKEMLRRATRAETVAVLNDLQAPGHALGHIDDSCLTPIIPQPEASPNAARLVINIGTGFNVAAVYETETGRYVPPAEAGHANLPIRTEADLRLLKFIETAHGFPGVEDLLSGRGLERAYAFHAREAGSPAEKSSQAIISALEDGSDLMAEDAARMFVRLFGTVAGNLSLIFLPFGGVYLVGGMAKAMKPYYANFGFEGAFRDKGRFAGFMGNFGVTVVEDDFAPLTGCAAHSAALLAHGGSSGKDRAS